MADPDLPDSVTASAISAFRARLQDRYGSRLVGLILFGSRARGNHRPDSDADVAVFLDDVDHPVAEQMELADDAYAVFLDTGVLVQPWVFAGPPLDTATDGDSPLLAAIRQDGIVQ
ncbi:MAG: nucleotidyltransferase domain-containing protein [Thiohalocapsa sp.]|jgi:predicted nucleotidyltransferase